VIYGRDAKAEEANWDNDTPAGMNANTVRSSCAPIEKEAARGASSARFELRDELLPFGQQFVAV
jgi:hypothetical protein